MRNMKPCKKYRVPKYILRHIPCGIERLNTTDDRFYGLQGLCAYGDWYEGMFMHDIYDWYTAEYIIDLREGVWWKCEDFVPSIRHLEYVLGVKHILWTEYQENLAELIKQYREAV